MRRYGKAIGSELAAVITALCCDEALPGSLNDHQLVSWRPPARECHIRPDLLLIYRLTPDTVQLVRLGTHSDLF